MSVTTVEPDLDNLTLTVVADFEASVEEVWELWANSEKLGRWWGPPEYLTTFEPYDLSAGAEMALHRSGHHYSGQPEDQVPHASFPQWPGRTATRQCHSLPRGSTRRPRTCDACDRSRWR